MKIPATTVLLLILSVIPVGTYANEDPASGGISAVEEKISSNILTESASSPSPQFSQLPPGVSALDLSLFGIISLGVIGLFWIRRHTSEL